MKARSWRFMSSRLPTHGPNLPVTALRVPPLACWGQKPGPFGGADRVRGSPQFAQFYGYYRLV